MSKGFKRGLIVFLAIVVIVVSGYSLPFFSRYAPQILNKVSASDGRVLVDDYNIAEESVYLSGEWEFFWDRHIVSQGLNDLEGIEPDDYVTVPSSWTMYELNGKKLDNGGIASYRLYLDGVHSDKPFLVSVNNMPGECNVFIDGTLVYTNRTDREIESISTNPISVKTDGTPYEVVIEVDCEYTGGIMTVPVLSTYSDFTENQFNMIALRFFFLGIAFLFAVSVFIISIMNHTTEYTHWLVVLCVSFIVRMLITNEGYLVAHRLFGSINYEIMTSLVYVSTYIIKLSAIMYIINVLRVKIPTRTLVLICAMFLSCAFVPYLFYSYIYVAYTFILLQSVTHIVDVYMISEISKKIVDNKKNAIPFLIAYCVMVIGIIEDTFYINGYLTLNVSSVLPAACVAFISVMAFMYFSEIASAYKKAEKTAQLSKELSDMNTTLMLSQIQPHFLFNALNTIKYLIKKDSKTAETAIVKFSNYLRANMDSLTQKEPIEFTKELEHVKNYLSIEKLRFGDRLNIEYDIKFDDFKIPPLTIQPIAENSVKHGINQKPEGGTLKISSYEDGNYIYVVIEDDGVGFDPSKEPENKNRSHVGMANIKERLEKLLKANINTDSIIGVGTKTTIIIPKGEVK
ncbi:MAG: sensor histidine kinase [Acutalibacteraceae bacterium]